MRRLREVGCDRFGGIDVLVNNTSRGYFEELTHELLEPESTFWAERSIDDYAARNPQFRAFFQEKNRNQEGDPVKRAEALISITRQEKPPFRWIAGRDANAGAERKVTELQQQINAYRDLSISLAYEDA